MIIIAFYLFQCKGNPVGGGSEILLGDNFLPGKGNLIEEILMIWTFFNAKSSFPWTLNIN